MQDKTYLISISKEELKSIVRDSIKETLRNFNANPQTAENKNPDSLNLLTIKDVMRLFQISRVTVNTWCNKAYLKPYKINGSVYFKKEEINTVLENNISL